jgi:hypothetical protein
MAESEITPPTFSHLAECLLRGGIPPHLVKRTVAELQDHYIDLYGEAVFRGLSAQEAEQEALLHIGKEQDLINEALSQKALRSWSSRYPWAIYGLWPSLFAILVGAIPIWIFEPLLTISDDMTVYLMPDWMQSPLIQNLTNGVFFLASYIIPLIIAGYVCHQASIRRDALRWPIFGIVLLCTIAGSYNVSIIWPDLPGTHIYLSGGFDIPGLTLKSKMLIRALANLTLVAIFMAWCLNNCRFHKNCPNR